MGGILDLFNVLYDPPAVFARVKEKPQFWGPFIGLAVFQVAIALLMLPYSRALMQAMAQARGGAAAPPGWAAWIGVVGAPLFLAIGLLIGAGVLWMLVSVLAGDASFRHLLSVATYVSITAILFGLAGYAVLKLGGGRVETPADLRPAFGLDLLTPDASRPVKTLLGMVNPFTLWGLVLTALGVSGTHKMSSGTAWTIASIAFVINAVIATGFSFLGGGG